MTDHTATMSSEEYVNSFGVACPCCRKTEGVQAEGNVEISFNSAYQNIVCVESLGGCGKEWTDEYPLTGFDAVE